jgi:DNA-binding NarL/FixJ family response regulator
MATPQPLTRILIVDDHVIFREGVTLLLHLHPDLRVVGQAGRADAALALALGEQPDVILLDVDLAGCDGLDIIESLHALAPRARIIVLTGMRMPDLQGRVLRLGAKGFLPKVRTSSELLIRAIRRVVAGELWFDRGVVDHAVSRWLRYAPESTDVSLSPAELNMLRLVGEGLTNPVMAKRLSMSRKAVRQNLQVICDKVGVDDRLNLAVYAYRQGLTRLSH